MKKLRPVFLLLLLFLEPAVAQAQYTYIINPNNSITITRYSGAGGAVTIPTTIDGMFVVSIGDSAFYFCPTLTSVVIPILATNIGNSAFSACERLTSVTMIPSKVISIGDYAFSDTSLSSITIPDSVTGIGDDAFSDTSLNSVTIPDSVGSIGAAAFSDCTNLTKVTISGSVTNIGNYAFGECSSLANVTMTIPSEINSIGEFAFSDTSLSSFAIPDSVTNIEGNAFDGCHNLTAITVGAQNAYYSSINGVLLNNSQTVLIEYPGGQPWSYSIPRSVTSIGEFAFAECMSLTNITIPNSVGSIGAAAFAYCTNLNSVTIPGSVTRIGASAFESCDNLTNIYFEGNFPFASSDSFAFDNTTAYYLPGTGGGGELFSADTGVPTKLWRPLIQAGNPSFGIRSNEFGFNISWASGMVVVVEACANLTNPVWSPLQTLSLTNGSFYFSDPHWTNYPGRFYRLTTR